MKKLAVLLLVLLLAPSALGQSVGASQIKKKANGGLVADSANALTVAVHRGTTAPSSPVAGMLWCDTTTDPCSMKVYSGSAWGAPPNTAVQVQATLATLPTSPTDGQIVWVSSQGRAIVYDGTAAKWYYLDGPRRLAGVDYSIDTVGYSTAFLAPPDTTGSVTSGGSMTVGDHTCAVTYYSETGGETTPGTAFTGTVATNKTFALSFAATTTGAFGKRVYCSKANTTTPLFLVTSIDDTTTGTYNVTVADTSFGVRAAPDENFSAPLPADWVFSVPDRSYGGCGSTGDGLMCSVLKSLSGSVATYGVRLFYTVPSDPDAWRATWTVSRLAKGFDGGVGAMASPIIAALGVNAPFADASIYSWAFNNNVSLPYTAASTPTMSFTSRPAAGAASAATAGPQLYPPLTSSAPIFVMASGRKEGGEYSARVGFSGNGLDFAYYPYVSANSATQRSYTTGYPLPSRVRFIGIALETWAFTGATMTDGVIKITNFRWASE